MINIFLEYVDGGTVASLTAKHGRFADSVTRLFVRQILLGLEYLHDRRIIHRDIKGANILVDQNGMAPEVIKAEKYAATIDVWSLGCVTVEMLSGARPWHGFDLVATMYKLGTDQTPPLPADASDVAKDFLARCFVVNIKARPSVADLLVHPYAQYNPHFKFEEWTKNVGVRRTPTKIFRAKR
ncbi:MAG: kinase-like domain-containing protein [Olpidium bornovanus]|uniref:Kinase-like domain-containing protein n=1 Tax=Olpidium bornovanus TaxID=278681 RepID=A0A8H7ZT34_9FUNG|nr:MAG: kinase-like domain-containing protein [Olpidium bornovanus]